MLKITKSQAARLDFAFSWDEESFPYLLEDYTGLKAKPVSMFQIFDGADDYIGDTHNDTLNDIFRKAGIEVVDDDSLE